MRDVAAAVGIWRWRRDAHGAVSGSQLPSWLGSYTKATGADLAIVTAHPFDISALRTQAAIKKIEASPVYRLVLEPDEQAQRLAMQRGKMIVVAMGMGAKGLPMREADPFRDNFPCNYCEWKSKCIADGAEYGLMLPAIPWPARRSPLGG